MKLFSLLFILGSFLSFSQVKTDFTERYSSTNFGTSLDIPNLNLNAPILKTSSCSNSSEGTIPLTGCADIGSSAFNTNSLTSTVDFNFPVTMPSPTPACFVGSELAGNWSVYDLASGVDGLVLRPDMSSLGVTASTNYIWMTFYQGTDCSNLTEVACEGAVIYDPSIPAWVPLDPVISGLDDTQPLWIFTSSDNAYLLDIVLRGVTTPVNEACAGAVSTSTGCNLGATPETWTGPSANGVTCTGGTWYSNENTVYYTFTATSTNATLEVQNVVCNDGTTGEAQFAVWDACGNVGDYTTGFSGCAVGAGTLTMPALTIGNSYIIVADGQAGDACTWDFVTTGIALPTELINLNAESLDGYNRVYWSTVSEVNSDYFIVEKSIDGYEFEAIGTVKSAGSSQSLINYTFNDYEQRNETVYYRLKQIDQNGEFEYHGPRPLNYIGKDALTVSPNPLSNGGAINFAFKAKKSYVISIMDVSGREIALYNVYNSTFSSSYVFETRNIQKGMYTVRVINEEGKVAQTNFIKN